MYKYTKFSKKLTFRTRTDTYTYVRVSYQVRTYVYVSVGRKVSFLENFE